MDELCEQFQRESREGGSGLLVQRVGRSEAAARLLEEGKRALPAIARHIRAHEHDPDFDHHDMRGAWAQLLMEMKKRIDPEGQTPRFADTPAWLAWADRHSET